MEQIEHFYTCPHCFETVSVLLDPSEPDQEMIEDCEVCCNANLFTITFSSLHLANFCVEKAY